MKRVVFFLSTCFLLHFSTFSQQTVGLFLYTPDAYPGYTLFAPAHSTTTYLIDNCGNLHFTWESNYVTGHTVELTETGTLIRACRFDNGSAITGGGAGGRIEAIKMDQQIDWAFEYSNDTVRLHHDFEILPNGNLLMIAWEAISQQEAIDFGRDPSKVGGSGLWPEQVIEYNPSTDQIVWKWRAWDHVIQDFDSTKPNFGNVADHPELFNLNFDKGGGSVDWQHMNAIDYNAERDQILLCSPFWNEIYIIDHSTSTSQASGHTGGNAGMGGDILWRWGNPEMYGAGDSTHRMLYNQHDAHWIPAGHPHEHKIILFNNGKGRTPLEYSSVDILSPSILPNGAYEMDANDRFLPTGFDYSYVATNPTDFYSHNISSAQMLPNGNIVIDEGAKGHFFEIDSAENIVWDYVNPVVQDSILAQEQPIPGTANLYNRVFRAKRIAHDYPGVTVLPLVNQGPIERDPYPSTCTTQLGVEDAEGSTFFVYPSPTSATLMFSEKLPEHTFEISNVQGQSLIYGSLSYGSVDVSKLEKGIYYVKICDKTGVNSKTIAFIKQ